MMDTRKRIVLCSLVGALLTLSSTLPSTGLAESQKEKSISFTGEQIRFYEKEVVPLLKENCYKCHAGSKIRGGLRLDNRAAILKGGDLGPAVVMDKIESSPFLKAIHHRDNLEMPPDGKLSAEKIAVLERWVRMGLPFSANAMTSSQPEKVAPSKEKITQEDRNWWAYQPVRMVSPPVVKQQEWARNPIDTFILEQLQAKGLRPNPPADRLSLIRRLTYDLTGLPPTPEEVDAFLADKSPSAYESLVDRLLSSPAHGEKWGRHWLDLVRYAETNGYERDGPKPYAWRFRDYVIRGFNADKPFNRFVQEQLAGDEMADEGPDPIIATGFFRLGVWDDEPADPKQARSDEVDDWVSTTSQVFLGMSLNCARCHDHKKDPISQGDYYRFSAFFQDIKHFSSNRDPRSAHNLTDITPASERHLYETELNHRKSQIADLSEQMRILEDEIIKRMPPEDQRASEGLDRPQVVAKLPKFSKPNEKARYDKLSREKRRLENKPDPVKDLALSVNNCFTNPPETRILIRGNPHAAGAKVTPGYPVVFALPDPPTPAPSTKSSNRRSVLAGWITHPDNPLTARVFANRLWQHHFGKGIVPSSNDFGKLGELPSHPALLDWLAGEFRKDWSMKRMHRLIVTSATYQMSSRSSAEGMVKDPTNTTYWRYPMRRLTAEEVRDGLLAVSGKLNRQMEGDSIFPHIPGEVLAGQSRPGEGWRTSRPEEQARRSVYVHIKRSLIVPVLSIHDAADTDNSCSVRYTTTVPTQSLGMLNGEFSQEQALALAERSRQEIPGDLSGQVRRIIRLIGGRDPSPDEVRKDLAFIHSLQEKRKLDEKDALIVYCLLMVNSNEMIYLD